MSDKIVEIGRLFIEIFKTVPSGCRVDIWKGDEFIRPTRRELLVSLTGEESSAILNAINEICGVTEVKPQPQPAPVPKLVEAVEDIGKACEETNEPMSKRLAGTIGLALLALAAEKRRQGVVDKVIQAARSQLSPDIMDAPCGCPCCEAIAALDAFDKGAENG